MNNIASNDELSLHNVHAVAANARVHSVHAHNVIKWRTLKDAAKNVWGRLSDEELDNVDGSFHALIGLIRARYHVSYDGAYDQVKLFFDKEATSQPFIECVDIFWSQKVKAAHQFWPGLSEPDLELTKGEPKKLVELLQQNYIIAFSEAVRQVDTFLGQQSEVGMR